MTYDSAIDIRLNHMKICQTNELKILGVYIDNKLNFKTHVDKLRSKIRKFLPIFFKFRKFMSLDNLFKIYFANIYSLMTYCILVYATGNKSNFDKLSSLHRRILKIIFRTNSESIKNLMIEHNLLDLDTLYRYRLLSLSFLALHEANRANLPTF